MKKTEDRVGKAADFPEGEGFGSPLGVDADAREHGAAVCIGGGRVSPEGVGKGFPPLREDGPGHALEHVTIQHLRIAGVEPEQDE